MKVDTLRFLGLFIMFVFFWFDVIPNARGEGKKEGG